MDKMKCDCCKKKFDKKVISCECNTCYASGWKKEGFIELKRVGEVIERLQEYGSDGLKKIYYIDAEELKKELGLIEKTQTQKSPRGLVPEGTSEVEK